MSKIKTFERGYKLQIYPTQYQAEQIEKLFNYTRFVYNWGIAKEYELRKKYENKESERSFYDFLDLAILFISERKTNPNLSWTLEFPYGISKLPLRNVSNGFKMFFKGKNPNIPHFKSKKYCKKSFNTRNDTFNIKNGSVKFEGVETRVSIGFDFGIVVKNGDAMNPVVSKDYLGNYYISFNLIEKVNILDIPKTQGIGIDLGVRQTFALSTGEIFNQPNEILNKLERRRRKLQRHITRDINRRLSESMRTRIKYENIPKSKQAIKRENKLNKIYRKIHNIKETYYHTTTKMIVERNPEFVCMETIHVKKLLHDPYIAKQIVNVSFFDITQKMKHKCEERGIPFIQAPREFASTKLCSNCGSVKEMYGYHTYKCPVCGMVEDRDINAAINLMNYGYTYFK